ncbi:hypothetical protein [Acinetobacter sp. ANC 3832]|uniref:hypothetical protein n=1 Tax=Acinetobacter sp. ANC 3832 TaxID=1977874 RepID=UPI000A32E368|nr:hypothetical protein [Acinetobacter sp. ANC 3832]OTG94994.1 hypothetical protein B9T35_06440 [Acinetobacter sp. ANC 3832]
MLFKYQAPDSYKSTHIVISGQSYEVKDGIVSSNEDIYFALQPMQFTRYVDEPKKSTVVATTKS